MRPEKQYLINELSENIKDSKGFFVTSFVGLKSEQLTSLHKGCRKELSKYLVVKNRVFKKALSHVGINVDQNIDSSLKGSSAIAFSKKDAVALAKMLINKEKESNGLLKIKGGFVEGKWFNQNDVIELSKLPSREVLLGKLLGTFKAPLNGFVSVLSGPVRSLVCAMNAVVDKNKSE